MNLKSAEEFDRLLEALVADIWSANHHYNLHWNLRQAIPEYENEFNQANTFWTMTIDAHFHTSILCLCRIYERHRDALHLYGWLKLIKNHLHFFTGAGGGKPAAKDPVSERIARNASAPDQKQLDADLDATGKDDKLVKKLYKLRCNVYAHKNADGVVKGINWGKVNPISYNEIKKLNERALEILNRYSALFKNTTYSGTLIGEDDYQSVLRFLRLGLEKHREVRDAEINRALGRQNSPPAC